MAGLPSRKAGGDDRERHKLRRHETPNDESRTLAGCGQ